MSAVEKSCAVAGAVMGHAMDEPCPVCRGGWWYDDGELAMAVHAAECPLRDPAEQAQGETP